MKCMEELMKCSYELIHMIGEYMKQAQDEELRKLLQQHLPYILQAYNEQVNFQEGENIQHVICEQFISPIEKMNIKMKEVKKGDSEVALAYLSHLKQVACGYALVAVEVANPEFRSFLESCFVKMNRYAYGVWQYVMKKEYKIENIFEDEKYA